MLPDVSREDAKRDMSMRRCLASCNTIFFDKRSTTECMPWCNTSVSEK